MTQEPLGLSGDVRLQSRYFPDLESTRCPCTKCGKLPDGQGVGDLLPSGKPPQCSCRLLKVGGTNSRSPTTGNPNRTLPHETQHHPRTAFANRGKKPR